MKIINFGSLNIDRVYSLRSFVQPGETVMAADCHSFPGGKGLNQSIAASRAGAQVIHAGAVGEDGGFLLTALQEAGVDAGSVRQLDGPGGHAIIQVNSFGQNCIIVYGGTNQQLDQDYIDAMLQKGQAGDIVLLQNETNEIGYIIKAAHRLGLTVAFNPSPMPEHVEALALHNVDFFLVNEIEGAHLAGMPDAQAGYETILQKLSARFPQAGIVLTLGDKGVLYQKDSLHYRHDIYPVQAVDTTAAGDTFCGYFLAGLCRGASPDVCLQEASAASAIAVSKEGASPSIPMRQEVLQFIQAQAL